MTVNISEEKCVGCGECVPVCPEEALSVWAQLTVDDERCTDCAICTDYCPVDALSL
ncbi:MAG: 4Fe-4S binding protein [Chloroflexi bacterium]|nr:4Fe-4S binding protein [Chloroflexota bacterium]